MKIRRASKTILPYDMFDVERSAEEAKRLVKCERIYHRGQALVWDGREVLSKLMAEHGGVQVEGERKEALRKIFNSIMWGELAAWKISTQLADRLEPLEAKMAATSQAHDEARHFYVLYDYMRELGPVPKRLDRAPEMLIGMVLGTDNLAHKLLGMQLMLETLALTVFQTVREAKVEPVLTELMKYYERDEARHVGLGVQYLPAVIKAMSRREVAALILFQCRALACGVYYAKQIEPHMRALGIDPRVVLSRGRRKQVAALRESFEAIGISLDRKRNVALIATDAASELLFPPHASDSLRTRVRSAWEVVSHEADPVSMEEFDVHQHALALASSALSVDSGTSAAAGSGRHAAE